MATLQQLDPTAKVYRKYHFDYRKTRIGMTQGAAQSEPYGRDAAMDDVDRRKKLHTALDKLMSRKNYTEDRAARMHAALDRLLDDPNFNVDSDDEPEEDESAEPDEMDEVENVTKHESSSKDSGRMSHAMDAGKCSACKIADGKPLPAGIAATVKSIIAFWAEEGIHLRPA